MDLGSILSGPIGAITGAIGAIGGKIIDYKMQQIANENDLAMKDKERELAVIEFANKSELAKIDADTQTSIRDLDALTASVAADRATYGDSMLGRIVDFMRGVTRPLITYAAMVLVVYDTVIAMKGDSLTQSQRMDIINTALFLAGVAITWWYGTRPNRKG